MASLLLLGASTAADAARPFGHKAAYPRAPKEMAAPKLRAPHLPDARNPFRRVQNGTYSFSLPSSTDATQVLPARRVTSGGTNLFGYLNYAKGGPKQGWYEIGKTDLTMLWADPLFNMANGFNELLTSWVRNDRLCGYCDWYQYGYFWGQIYYEIDLATGMVEVEETDEDCIYDGGVFISAVYDPEEDAVYGYGTDDWDQSEVTTATFQKTTAYPWGYDVLKDISSREFNNCCKSLAYNPIDKGIYGITLDNRLVKIDKATGNQTLIANLSVTGDESVTGMCYSTTEGLFYWNPAFAATRASLVTINPRTGATNTVMEFNEYGDSFGCLAEIGSNVVAASPFPPQIISYDFPAGSTSGTFTIKLPTEHVDGSLITKNVTWYATANGIQKATGTGAAGNEVTVNFSGLASGQVEFGFQCEVDGIKGAAIMRTLYVGSDTPKAPASVTLEKDNIHWTAVREGVNGGYIVPEDITYEVYLDGNLVTTTGRTNVKINVGADEPYSRHQAYVSAVYDNHKSARTFSNYLNAGLPWELPVNLQASQDMLDLCTVYNLDNEYENWWEVDPYRDPYAFYAGQADDIEGNDWLILPAMNFPDADALYSLYLTCMSVAAKYDSRVEVCIGEYPDPTSMDRVIISEFKPQSRDYATYSQPAFKVPYEGEYYIGIHAKTGKNSCGVMVSGIRVENNHLTVGSPVAVSGVTATAGAEGALEANVSFTMPVKDVQGNDLPSSPITAILSAAGVTGSVEVTGNPGQAMTATVPTLQGDNTISISLRQDGKQGEIAYVNVYTGVTIPGMVKNMEVNVHPDMMGIDMTWEAPSPDKVGGYVNPATVEYFVIIGNDNGLISRTSIGTGLNSYSLQLPVGTAQDYYRVGIEATNVAGTTGRYMAVTILLGTPYDLPIAEDYENEILYMPYVVYGDSNSNVDWFMHAISDIANEWKDMDGVALCGVGDPDKTDASTLGLPRFSTLGITDAKISIRLWTGEQSANVKILGSVYGMEEPIEVGAIPYTNSDSMSMWKTLEYALPASIQNSAWTQIFLDAAFGVDHNYVIIDSLEIGSASGVMMAITAEGSVLASEGRILVKGFEGKNVSVATLDGKAIFSGKASERLDIPAPQGICIVKAGERVYKVIVR